jgi:hypothetical protein
MSQASWEIWFVSSATIFLTFVFINMLANSNYILELPYLLILSGINFILAILYGWLTITSDDE